MTDKQTDETLDPPVFRLKQMRRLLAEHNYYGNPIDDDFAALDAAIAALERQRVPEGWKLVPMVPTIDMLLAIKGHGKFPEDWEAGKKLQREYGLEVVPPECNIEIAAGQYVKLLAAAPEPSED